MCVKNFGTTVIREPLRQGGQIRRVVVSSIHTRLLRQNRERFYLLAVIRNTRLGNGKV